MSWLITGTQKTDPDALAYLSEVERADGQALESGTRDAVIAFVAGCKADGIWTAIKASCILAGARTLTGALVPLVGTAPTNVGGLFVSGDYNRKTGLKGDGSTKGIDSNRPVNADAFDNGHISIYITEIRTLGVSLIGEDQDKRTNMYFNGTSYRSINVQATPNPNNLGFSGMARSVSTEYVVRTAGATTTLINTAFETTATGSIIVFGRRSGADPGSLSFSNPRLSFYSIGESLNLATLDARVTDLINAFAAAIP
jgi:hypothetical protein